MSRVFLIPTAKDPRKEVWLEAVTVRDSQLESYWEFVDVDGVVVGRFDKARVDRFEQAEDRRRPRRLTVVATQPRDIVWEARFNDPKPVDPGP